MIRLIPGLLLFAAMPPAVADNLEWLAGHWCNESGEELWLPERGGLMLGLSRSVRGTRTFFEFLRIEIEGEEARYLAQPGGVPPTRFTRSASAEGSVEFSNPQHDFPKRIRYWRDGNTLHAAIDDGDEGKAMQFAWERCSE